MQDFWNVIKFFGPLAVIQVSAYVAAVMLVPGNHGVLFVSQLTVTLIASSAGFNAGKRAAQGEANTVTTDTEW